METKAKKRLFNGIMILILIVLAAAGVFTAGKIQGWFGGSKETILTSKAIKGVADMERKGIGYMLDSDIALQKGDAVATREGAQAELLIKEKGSLVLNENTEIVLTECSTESMMLELKRGELFADTVAYEGTFQVCLGEMKAELTGCVFSVDVQEEKSNIYVYAGKAEIHLADGTEKTVDAGSILMVEKDTVCQSEELQSDVLSDFLLGRLQNCIKAEQLCFTSAELQKLQEERTKEKHAVAEEKLNGHQTAENTCTVAILCNTILDNIDLLDAGKEAYVPEDGVILAETTVGFETGETAFDVLKRICESMEIQIEYSWTAVYDSYYIEGINHLYEFDCGNESGWMYKVNDQFPNYGSSSYELEDGDKIVWQYTCKGFGADVGAEQ